MYFCSENVLFLTKFEIVFIIFSSYQRGVVLRPFCTKSLKNTARLRGPSGFERMTGAPGPPAGGANGFKLRARRVKTLLACGCQSGRRTASVSAVFLN